MRSIEAILFDSENFDRFEARAAQPALKPSKQQWARWMSMRQKSKSSRVKARQV